MMPTTTALAQADNVVHSLLTRLLALAYVDQEVDLREVELIYSIARERGIAQEKLEAIMLRPHTISTVLPNEPHERVLHLYDLARLVVADGIIKDEERAMLRRSVLLYEFDEENADEIVTFLLAQAESGAQPIQVAQLVQDSN
jgi:uncharacterized membrane protein YebE (DUF533 family)